ncbi:MAG: hypothetical protein ACC662_07425, partial [Planctomycetota bacterium]
MSGMTVYFARRLLLVPITFLAITFMVYAVLRFVPGGPIEQAETMMKLAANSGEAGGGGGVDLQGESGLQLDEDAMHELEAYYALDRSVFVGYLQWLGLWPRERKRRVPPVARKGREEAFAKLEAAHEAVGRAEADLGALLEGHGLFLWRDHVVRAVEEKELALAARRKARGLFLGTFGAQYALQAHVEGGGVGYDGRRWFREAGRPAGGEAW